MFKLNRIELDEDTTIGALAQRLDRCTYLFGTDAKITVREEDGRKYLVVGEEQ